jgi:alanine racemase
VTPVAEPQVLGESAHTPTLSLDPDLLAANVRRLGGDRATPMIAVVKADGFGHGAHHVGRAALAAGARMLGVATLAEALEISDLEAPVLTWLNAPSALRAPDVPAQVEYALGSLAHLTELTATLGHAVSRRHRLARRVHLFVDTGMSRDGCDPREWTQLCTQARRAERAGLIRVVGVMGHLGCTAPADPDTQRALWTFRTAVRAARGVGLRPSIVHLAGTAAALGLAEAHHSAIRPGAGLIGIDPEHPDGAGSRLRPVARLSAPVLQVRQGRAGELVGYGHAHRLEHDTWLGLVGLGYADGIPGTVSPAGPAALGTPGLQVAGRRCPLVGQVSMDQVVVDLGRSPVALQTSAVVFGPGRCGEPTLADWVAWSGRRPHEIVTGLGRRITRTVGAARAADCGLPRNEAA